MRKYIGGGSSWPLGEVFLIFLPFLAAAYIYIVIRSTAITEGGKRDGHMLAINISIAIPVIIIWTIAAVSSYKFKCYTEKIKASTDGRALKYIADSLLFLTLYVIIRGSSGYITHLFKNTGSVNTIVAVENYLPVTVGLVAAGLLLIGTMKLQSMASVGIRKSTAVIIALVYVLVCAAFSWHFYQIFYHLIPHDGIPKFAGSRLLIMLTYIPALLLKWGLLVIGCTLLYNYSIRAPGRIYKQLFKDLYKGIVLVFISTFMVQLFIDSNYDLSKFDVGLILIYIMLLLAVAGFIEIYRGAIKLGRLEEV